MRAFVFFWLAVGWYIVPALRTEFVLKVKGLRTSGLDGGGQSRAEGQTAERRFASRKNYGNDTKNRMEFNFTRGFICNVQEHATPNENAPSPF